MEVEAEEKTSPACGLCFLGVWAPWLHLDWTEVPRES